MFRLVFCYGRLVFCDEQTVCIGSVARLSRSSLDGGYLSSAVGRTKQNDAIVAVLSVLGFILKDQHHATCYIKYVGWNSGCESAAVVTVL